MIKSSASNKRIHDINRRGFTVIELMVCLIVIAMITAILMQAVLAVRESSRSLACKSNLRQIGIAIQSYVATFEVVTPGQYSFEGRSYHELSPLLTLLPYLEQSPLYNAYNYLHMDRNNTPLIENRTVRNTKLSVYLCPSDQNASHLNSYVFNVGRSLSRNGETFNDGPFGLFKLVRPETMANGSAQTAFLSERLSGGFNDELINKARDFKVISFAALKQYVDDQAIALCESTSSNNWYTMCGRYWLYWSPFHTAYSHSSRPNDQRSACGGFFFGILPARSNHSGRVHVLFGDAHTQAVSSRVDRAVWEKMGTCY